MQKRDSIDLFWHLSIQIKARAKLANRKNPRKTTRKNIRKEGKSQSKIIYEYQAKEPTLENVLRRIISIYWLDQY